MEKGPIKQEKQQSDFDFGNESIIVEPKPFSSLTYEQRVAFAESIRGKKDSELSKEQKRLRDWMKDLERGDDQPFKTH
ncbi:MAG: hypothetical protein WCP17_02315 [bacterium]